jgi:glycosyltransferase involved in cell wall biosynthesis
MNVAFDISALGVGHHNSAGRTGIYRAVDRLVQGLVASPECALTLVAGASFEVLRDSLDYFDSNPALHSATMHRRRFLGAQVQLERALRALNKRPASPANRLARECVSATRQLLGAASGPLDNQAILSADVYHSPKFPLPPPGGRTQRVSTCYDLIPIRQPEFVLPAHREFLEQVLNSVQASDWVICISEWVRQDLCEYLHFDPARTFVTYLAADPALFHPEPDEDARLRVRKRYGIPDGPYYLSLATLEPRRNVQHLVRCFRQLVEQEHLRDASLVLVGNAGWGALAGAGSRAEQPPDVIVTGYAADEDLAALYSGALAFVYPSLAEGFGLTPLEAMQCGVPVITSNTTSLPEVVGDAAIQVDPTDAAGLCDAMLNIYRDADLRARLAAQSLARARLFSWSKTVQSTIDAYRVAHGGRG